MRPTVLKLWVVIVLATGLFAQDKRLWVLRAPGEMVEYDLAKLAAKQTVKVPAQAVQSPQNLSMNHSGQMLFAAPVALPLPEEDLTADRTIWIFDGHQATTLNRELQRETAAEGSNVVVTEQAPMPRLAADGSHLYWFANQARRLQREGIDLSTKTTWLTWQTDLSGNSRQTLVSLALPDCRCTTGSCEESCPYGEAWAPAGGVETFFLLTQLVEGQTQVLYKASGLYRKEGDKWTGVSITPPLRRVLDAAAEGKAIVEAIPDSGCCGWENDSDDRTVLRIDGKTVGIFDERATYKNPNYDISFYTRDAQLSPDAASVAVTIVSTAKPNTAIQLSHEGQANPEESQQIRKALLDLPAVEVKTAAEPSRRLVYLPRASLVGWLNEKEILVVENHVLVIYNVAAGTSRRSTIRVEDAADVFLR